MYVSSFSVIYKICDIHVNRCAPEDAKKHVRPVSSSADMLPKTDDRSNTYYDNRCRQNPFASFLSHKIRFIIAKKTISSRSKPDPLRTTYGTASEYRLIRGLVLQDCLQKLQITRNLCVLLSAAAGNAVQAHGLLRDGDAFEPVALADRLRQTAADRKRICRPDDPAARIALVHHDPIAAADLIRRADGRISVGARRELLVFYVGIRLQQPVIKCFGMRRLRMLRAASMAAWRITVLQKASCVCRICS